MTLTLSPESLHPTAPLQNNIPPSIDLRHMTSNVVLASPTKDYHRSARRISQHLRTAERLGSPNSIPSSPTSVHSSSSAIFERDIEPIAPPSPPSVPHHPPNPHRIPRAKATEQLEQSVPSVLDSAAAILASTEESDGDQVSVVAPASALAFEGMGRSSGFASPMSFRSRSPSPLGSRAAAAAGRTDLLLSIPSPMISPVSTASSHVVSSMILSPPGAISPLQSSSSTSTVPLSSSPLARPKVLPDQHQHQPLSVATAPSTSSITPSLVTPTSAYFSTTSSVGGSGSGESSPTTTTREHPSSPIPASPSNLVASSLLPTSSPLVSPVSLSSLSHPPSPTHVARKRLSFMSYSDLLSSTPASTLPLSSLTTSASTSEPPPHIPSVSGLNLVTAAASVASANASATGSLRGFSLVPLGGLTHAGKRDSIALLDNVGGEWEREGLGRGLEERLDALVIGSPGGLPSPLPPYVGGGKA